MRPLVSSSDPLSVTSHSMTNSSPTATRQAKASSLNLLKQEAKLLLG